MNRNHDISDSELDRMVEAYFDCTLTAAEERELGVRLAALSEDRLTGDRREALAGISLAAMARRRQRADAGKSKRSRIRTWTFAAAAAVAAVLLVVAQLWSTPDRGNECYAYVDGCLITDDEAIMHLMASQIDDMADADERMRISIENELSEMGTAIDNFYNEIPLNL